MEFQRICVFCGSSPGVRPEYLALARQLGGLLAERGIGLVYGGGRLGMMGELARAALQHGGEVIGVIPKFLADKEVAFTGITELRVVDSMHARKAAMAELADAFIALPGGLGTLEEFFEVLTWGQLSIHQKPCGLLNVCGYYDAISAFLDHAVAQQFVLANHRAMILLHDSPVGLLEQFAHYQPKIVDKAAWALELDKS